MQTAALDDRLATIARQLALALGVVMLLLSAAFWYLARRFVGGPLASLTRTADEIAKGNIAHRSPLKSNDELGTLAATFNSMLDNLKEFHDAHE